MTIRHPARWIIAILVLFAAASWLIQHRFDAASLTRAVWITYVVSSLASLFIVSRRARGAARCGQHRDDAGRGDRRQLVARGRRGALVGPLDPARRHCGAAHEHRQRGVSRRRPARAASARVAGGGHQAERGRGQAGRPVHALLAALHQHRPPHDPGDPSQRRVGRPGARAPRPGDGAYPKPARHGAADRPGPRRRGPGGSRSHRHARRRLAGRRSRLGARRGVHRDAAAVAPEHHVGARADRRERPTPQDAVHHAGGAVRGAAGDLGQQGDRRPRVRRRNPGVQRRGPHARSRARMARRRRRRAGVGYRASAPCRRRRALHDRRRHGQDERDRSARSVVADADDVVSPLELRSTGAALRRRRGAAGSRSGFRQGRVLRRADARVRADARRRRNGALGPRRRRTAAARQRPGRRRRRCFVRSALPRRPPHAARRANDQRRREGGGPLPRAPERARERSEARPLLT